MDNILQKTNKIFLITNILFWIVLAISSLLTTDSHIVIKLLLFFEPILFGFALYGVIKKKKLIYALGAIFILTNIVLSRTDQMGTWDWISLLLSAISFVNMVIVYRKLFT